MEERERQKVRLGILTVNRLEEDKNVKLQFRLETTISIQFVENEEEIKDL